MNPKLGSCIGKRRKERRDARCSHCWGERERIYDCDAAAATSDDDYAAFAGSFTNLDGIVHYHCNMSMQRKEPAATNA